MWLSLLLCVVLSCTRGFADVFYLGAIRNKGIVDENVSFVSLLIDNQDTILTANVSVTTLQKIPQKEITIPPQTSIELELPSNLTVYNSTQRFCGIRVHSNSEISIALLSSKQYSSDTYQIYPNRQPESQEYFYYAITPGGQSSIYMRQILIVGTENETVVKVRPPHDITLPSNLQDPDSHFIKVNAASNYSGILNEMDTFYMGSIEHDLTGTLIASNKPLVVISGHECAQQLNSETCSFIAEQIPPTSAWGRKYVLSPIINDTIQQYVVISSADNTTINYTCKDRSTTTVKIMNEGDSYHSTLTSQCLLIADIPVTIAFLNNTFSNRPLMTLVPPVEQFVTKISFTSFSCVTHRALLVMFFNQTGGWMLYNNIHIKDDLIIHIPNSSAGVLYISDNDAMGKDFIVSSNLTVGIIVYAYYVGDKQGVMSSTCEYSNTVVWNMMLLEVPVVTFGFPSYSIYESDRYVFITINRTSLFATRALVELVVIDNAEIRPLNKIITFEAGQSIEKVNISVDNDQWAEPSESITLMLLPLLQSFVHPFNTSVITIMDDDNITVGLIGMQYNKEFNILSIEVGIIDGTLAPDNHICLNIFVQEKNVGNIDLSYIVVSQTTKVDLYRSGYFDNTTDLINVSLTSYSIFNLILNPSNLSDMLGNIVAPKKCNYIIGEFTQQTLLISTCVVGVLMILCLIACVFSAVACGISYQSRRKWILGGGLNKLYFQDDAISLATNDPESYELMNRLGERKTASLVINDDNEYT